MSFINKHFEAQLNNNNNDLASNSNEEYEEIFPMADELLDEEVFLPQNEENIFTVGPSQIQTVSVAPEPVFNGEVVECVDFPKIIENYKKEKVIKEHVKNIFYDEAIEIAESIFFFGKKLNI